MAEALRSVCFSYGNRFIEVEKEDSDNDDDRAEVPEEEGKTLIYQLPNTDAGPYDSARVSPSVLMAFAEDMMITPNLLRQEEATQAVVETLDRRRKRAHLPASMEKTLYDFMVVCANKIMDKRPYCNVYGHATTRQKVRALIDFVSVDYERIVYDVLDSRFSPINEIVAVQDAVQTETQRNKQKKRKYKTIDAARAGVSELWSSVHEIFLFFCETPLPRVLPDAENHTKPPSVQKQVSETSSLASSEMLELTHNKSTVEIKVEIKKVNLEAIVQFHPGIKRATEYFAARQIQRCFRKKYKDLLARKITISVVEEEVEDEPLFDKKPPRPPCGPAVIALLPRVHALTNKYSLSPHPPPRPPVNIELKIEEFDADSKGGGQGGEEDKLPGLRIPPLMITRPVHEIIEWKRQVVEEDSFTSSHSSASLMGTTEIPIYNDRLGVWTTQRAQVEI